MCAPRHLSPLQQALVDATEAKTRVETRVETRARSVVDILRLRDVAITDADRERILACDSEDTLGQWIERAATATDASEVFED